jgi:hypothetical protein
LTGSAQGHISGHAISTPKARLPKMLARFAPLARNTARIPIRFRPI